MTILEKLSDRGSFIFEAIKLITVNKGPMSLPKLQWELFQCGIYVRAPLLTQAVSVMKEKGLLVRQPEAKKEESKIITDGVFQKES